MSLYDAFVDLLIFIFVTNSSTLVPLMQIPVEVKI